MSRKDGYRVFPIIASPAEWPRAYTICWYIPEVLRETGWLADCEPIELVDIGEVERMEGLALAGRSITQLLTRKHAFPHDRIQSLHNYLTTKERGLLEPPPPAIERGSVVARRVMTLASTWGEAVQDA